MKIFLFHIFWCCDVQYEIQAIWLIFINKELICIISDAVRVHSLIIKYWNLYEICISINLFLIDNQKINVNEWIYKWMFSFRNNLIEKCSFIENTFSDLNTKLINFSWNIHIICDHGNLQQLIPVKVQSKYYIDVPFIHRHTYSLWDKTNSQCDVLYLL